MKIFLRGQVATIRQFHYILDNVIIDTQVGFSINRAGGVNVAGEKVSDGETAFSWAIGAGYLIKQIEWGVKYQSSHGDDAMYSLKFIALRVDYNFSL